MNANFTRQAAIVTFLAAALLAGGRMTIAGWPGTTTQVGDLFRTLLPRFGATVTRDADGLTVDGVIAKLCARLG